jgi:CheY-like chemotaxis protein
VERRLLYAQRLEANTHARKHHARTSAPRAPWVLLKPAWREGSHQPEKPLILIVEDDVWIRGIAGALLEDEGFAIASAADGQAGLAMAQRLKPALILLDLGLPRISGGEFLTRMRTRPDLQGIPVVVVSGQADPLPDVVVAQADSVLRKPVDMTELIDHVQHALRSSPANLQPT